ncbi:putative cross-wall-targeting lipoprotein signal domain-containing proteiin, partial [Streptococcus gallolyticus]|uniref:putative cross-wall-targeting lipoprotein signal domain-containing proteiin n=1 Tax=Streptococcus gallolyticus TaxID=315405 RepID=UPI002EDB2897
MKNSNVMGHGFFRKSKAYGLICGIALGLAFLGGQVSADEVTPPTTETTTAVAAAPASVADNT